MISKETGREIERLNGERWRLREKRWGGERDVERDREGGERAERDGERQRE